VNGLCLRHVYLVECLYVHTYTLYVQTYSSTSVRPTVPTVSSSLYTSGAEPSVRTDSVSGEVIS